MAEKHQNKHRRISARARWWNYGLDAAYFVTICTADRRYYFGNVINSKMTLSQTGVVANSCWYEILNHAKNVQLGEFVVMPNHVHGIVILKDNYEYVESPAVNSGSSHMHPRFQNPGKNTVSSIIGSYKSAVTKLTRRLGCSFAWQSRFHDHIIRNLDEYKRISNYIQNNPRNWKRDKFQRRRIGAAVDENSLLPIK
jgi:putative transposase